MCNPACIEFGHSQLQPAEVAGREVLEVGALDVNGSLRPLVEGLGPRRYVGVDITAGPGVDLLCDAGALLEHFAPASFDLVISTELVEHLRDWRTAFHNFKQLLRPGGLLLVTTRSLGFHYHGYPYDFWRYELEDVRRILADLDILALERDPIAPGVFVKARKPASFHECDLADIALHSVVTGKRTRALSDAALRRFRLRRETRRRLGQLLPEGLKRPLRRMLGTD